MTDARQPLIFISHTTRDPRDSERAHSLAAGLRRCGARTWIAPESIPMGAEWEEQLVAAIIDEATHFLVILSPASTRAEWVLKELDLARQRYQRDRTLTVLPLVVGDMGAYEGSAFVDALQRIPYHGRYTDQLRAVVAAVGLRTDVGSLLPLTMPSAKSESGRTFDLGWLGYKRRQAQLVGRAAEKTALQDFYDSPEPLKWWVIDGPGGVGKSRLVLESLLDLPQSWVRGFLDTHGLDPRELQKWIPDADTVVAVDDAAASVAQVEALLHHLEQRKSELKQKTRILLIERTTESQKWWTEICRQGQDDHDSRMAAFHQGKPLTIGRLDRQHQTAALRAFLSSSESSASVALPDSADDFWSNVDALSDRGRPLFLGLLAAAVAELGPEQLRSWNTGALVDFVYNREMTAWERLCPDEKLRRRVRDIVAIATACRGFDFERHEKLITNCLASLNLVTDLDDGTWDAVASVTGNPTTVVEPDVFGEYFLTRVWEKPVGRPTQPVVSSLLGAFDLRPAAVAYTIRNTVFDFPDSETPLWWMETLAKERFVEEQKIRIMELFVRAVRAYGDAVQFEHMERCLTRIREWARGLTQFGQEHNNLSEAATSAAVAYAREGKWPEVEELVHTLRSLAGTYPSHAKLQSDLIRSASTIIAESGESGRPQTVESAIEALEDVERRHPHIHSRRLAQAAVEATGHLIDSERSAAMARCLSMTQRLANLRGGVDEGHLRLMLAAAAFAGVRQNLRIRNWGEMCLAYLVLAKVYKERGSEKRIELLFDSAHQTLFADADALEGMKPVQQANRIVEELPGQDPALNVSQAEARLHDLRLLAETHPDYLLVSMCFARGLTNAISLYAATDDVRRIDAALEELWALKRRFPESSEMRVLLALGLDRAVEARPGDLERMNSLLGELRALDDESKAHFWHEADVAQRFAYALARAVRHHVRLGNTPLISSRLEELDTLVSQRFPWRDEMIFALATALRDAVEYFAAARQLEDVRRVAARLVELIEHSGAEDEEIVSTIVDTGRAAAEFYRAEGLESDASELETRLEEAAKDRLAPATGGLQLQLMALFRDSFAPSGIQNSFQISV